MSYADLWTVREHWRTNKECACVLCKKIRADIQHDRYATGGRFARLWLNVLHDHSGLAPARNGASTDAAAT